MTSPLLHRVGQWARRGTASRLWAPVKLAYAGLVNAEVAALTARAARHPVRPYDKGDVTLVVKTFERPKALRRFLASAQRVFAGPILVADDSRRPFVSADPQITVLALPFDSGVGAGKTALLEHVTTEFVWACDDDFVLLPDCDLAAAVDYLRRNADVDLYAGVRLNLPLLRRDDYRKAPLYVERGVPKAVAGTRIDGREVLHKVAAFHVGRTAAMRAVGYDPRLKRLDHADFFTAAYGRLLCVQDPAWRCLHDHTYFDSAYQAFRNDVAADEAYLATKWSGRSGVRSDLSPGARRMLHHAALDLVAARAGISVQHGSPDRDPIDVRTDDPEGLTAALRDAGWHGRDPLRHDRWGEASLGSRVAGDLVRKLVGGREAPVLDPASWDEPVNAERTAGPGTLTVAPDAGWGRDPDDDDLVAALLPDGPAIRLASPADVLWLSVLEAPGTPEEVVAEVLALFPQAPPEAAGQLRDTLSGLVRSGFLALVGPA